MDSDQGKLFIGGISWETSEEKLRDYFGQYGDVLQAVVMKDKTTGRPRGFGFVVFADPAVLDMVLQDKHTIDGRMVSSKPLSFLPFHGFCVVFVNVCFFGFTFVCIFIILGIGSYCYC